MRFQSKLICFYVVLVLLTTFVMGGWYYRYSSGQTLKTEYRNMEVLGAQYLNQMDENLKTMEMVCSYILSDPSVLEALRTMTMDKGDKWQTYRKEAYDTIREKLNTDYIINNFYRVIVFNANNDIISSASYGERQINTGVATAQLPWIDQIKGTKGRFVLFGSHPDVWGLKTRPQVMSVVKEIQGKNMGYIEVQQLITDWDEIFRTPNDQIHIVALKENGEILYTDTGDQKSAYYQELSKGIRAGSGEYQNPQNGEKEIISMHVSDATGVRMMIVESQDVIADQNSYTIRTTFAIALGFFLLSMGYVVIITRYLMKPVRKLKTMMENTRIESMEEQVSISKSNDELEAFENAYQNMMKRLKQAVLEEQRMAGLQIQAQFDLFQAQVNPHFLYNVLNVISNRGLQNDDDQICEMCSSLAAILRYSTNTKNRYALVRDEIQCLEKYFFLLKCRYEYLLEYKIEVEEGIRSQTMPKVILQPLVENAIVHGYAHSSEVMYIEIRGWEEHGKWFMQVADNGEGFSGEELKKLEKEMEETRVILQNRSSNIGMQLGGMGLVSIYMRLFYFYREDMIFHIHSGETGTTILIGGPVYMKEKVGEAYVSGTGRG